MTKNRSSEKTPITRTDLDRFHRNAPAALARRGPGFVIESVLGGAQTVITGGVPIVGLVYWDWSAVEMLLLLVVLSWVGILCDTAKLLWLRERAEAFANARFDDWHVWVVVDAIRSGENDAYASHLRAKWRPLAGVAIDFVMGGVSTVCIIGILVAEAGLGAQSFQSRGVMLGLAAMVGLRCALTAWEVARHCHADRRRGSGAGEQSFVETHDPDRDRPVKVAVGLRGVGLFLLVFLTAMLTGGDGADADAARWIMLVVNGLVVLLGVVNLLGPLMLRGETLWLRQYLADRARAEQAEVV